jgi:WD40-like Beta Propeller Repeat
MVGKGLRVAGRGPLATPRSVGVVALLLATFYPIPSTVALAQVPPNARWLTLRTRHFSVHFTPELEDIARRTAANAERAYAQLARELTPPRGHIDIVVSDNVDYSNGSASTVPSNRLYIYANPPVEQSALRFNDDWNALVVTHELTHLFHLDRVRGVWRLAQGVFGRAPPLFPNAYAPSWLTEGLAVYFESRLTESGRLRGSEHRMIARSTALEHRFPRLDQLSLATPHFPGGQVAYAYGSLIVEHLARTRGPERVRELVERTSGQLIPFLLERPASRAFGTTFARAWAELRDSLVREVGSPKPPMVGWRDLTPAALVATSPRWMGDSAIVYSGATTRDVHGAYRVRLRGGKPSQPELLGRRNSPTANVPLRDGGLLYSQLDFTDPYHIRSDLYVDRNGRTSRLTHGARLSSPDMRADGSIVATQVVPGGTQLVRISPRSRVILPLTDGGPDVQYMDPRWSPDGTRIVAVRWRRGGTTSIVLLDPRGGLLREISQARAVQGAPSWSPDGRLVLFSSDSSGIPELYAVDVASAFRVNPVYIGLPLTGATRISDARTGLFDPELSSDGRTIASVVFRADGYRVGNAPFPDRMLESSRLYLGHGSAGPAPMPGALVPAVAPRDSGRIVPYSPWSSLLPRYWLPLFEPGLADGYRLGGMTSGHDLVGRHGYGGTLLVPTDGRGLIGAFNYRYSGLGQPLLDATLIQDWELRARLAGGDIRRRTQHAAISATVVRPRYRTFASVTVGAGVQRRHFAIDPPEFRSALTPASQAALTDSTYPRAFIGASWTNAYRTAYGISPEEGIALEGSIDQRWGRGASSAASRTYMGSAAAYKSLDLPGFARHVVALRAAGGLADRNSTTTLEVGGASGGTLAILPGYAIGTGRRFFPVRGFATASLEGSRAVAASIEYRAPLLIPGRGLALLPFFLDRTSLSLFSDAGAAWCPASLATACYPAERDRRWIASVGAELNVAAAVLSWDVPYRFRLGVAHPVARAVDAPDVSPYFAVGLAF